ncbi:MAG: hypothetical protein C4308_07360 [Chitinophagaceae bacterium]
MKNYNKFYAAILSIAVIVIAISCEKDFKPAAVTPQPTPSPVPTGSFIEEFTNASDLSSKGWVFVNNSDPIGEAGWRQGRYEQINLANKKLATGVVTVGFPAYSAQNDPHDFISCDITACGNQTGSGSWSAWLISPAVPMKNGDSITFYTIANDIEVDPTNGISTTDRLQVRLNITDGSADVGTDTSSVGKFTRLIYDSNPRMAMNSAGGHPTTWRLIRLVVSGIPGSGSIPAGRFAFRYYIHDGGLYGGSNGDIFPSVVGVDQLKFIHK